MHSDSFPHIVPQATTAIQEAVYKAVRDASSFQLPPSDDIWPIMENDPEYRDLREALKVCGDTVLPIFLFVELAYLYPYREVSFYKILTSVLTENRVFALAKTIGRSPRWRSQSEMKRLGAAFEASFFWFLGTVSTSEREAMQYISLNFSDAIRQGEQEWRNQANLNRPASMAAPPPPRVLPLNAHALSLKEKWQVISEDLLQLSGISDPNASLYACPASGASTSRDPPTAALSTEETEVENEKPSSKGSAAPSSLEDTEVDLYTALANSSKHTELPALLSVVHSVVKEKCPDKTDDEITEMILAARPSNAKSVIRNTMNSP